MMAEVLWWIFAPLATLGGIMMITRKNPVASLLFLVLTLFSLGVLYILLGAHFIGVAQVIIYAGAIMVLFLFVIMLLNLGHDYRSDLRGAGWLVVGSVAAGLVGYAIFDVVRSPEGLVTAGPGMLPATAVEQYGAVGAVAMPLFGEYVVGFELTSLLLLVAIIGAILLAKRRV